MSQTQFNGQYVSVETKAPAILGARVQGKVVANFLTHAIASTYKDIAPLHAQIMPFLPEGDRVEFTDDFFILLQYNGEYIPYAISWLRQETMVIVTDTKIQVTIAGDMDQSRLRKLLLANGYKVIAMGTMA